MAPKRRAVTAEDVRRVLAQTEAIPSGRTKKKEWDARFKEFGSDLKARNKSRGYTTSGKPSSRKPVVPVSGKNVTEAAGNYLGQRNRTNAEAQALSGKKEPDRDKSLLEKGLHNLYRSQSGAANAFKEGFDPNDDKAYDLGGAIRGYKEGFKSDKTVSYNDILKEHGHKGKGWSLLGGALDIFGDPLTYTGVGLIGKAGKAVKYIDEADGTTRKVVKKLSQKEIREGLEESASIVKKGTQTPFKLPTGQAVGKKDIVEALGVERAAVSQLGKRQRNQLSTEARELYELAKATQKQQGKKYLRKGASETQHLGKKTSSGLIIKDVLGEMSNYSVKATRERVAAEVVAKHAAAGRILDKAPNPQAATWLKKQIADETEQRLAKMGLVSKTGKPVERELHENVVAAMNRNLSTTISNQLSVRVGTAKLGVPGVAALGRKSAELAGKPAFVRKTVKAFEDGFRANAHIPSSLRSMRRISNSTGATLLKAYGRQTQSVFDAIPAAERHRVASLWGKGHTGAATIAGGKTLDGAPVDDIFKYIDKEMGELDVSVRKNGILADELNEQLPDIFKVKQGKTKTVVETKSSNGRPSLFENKGTKIDDDYFVNEVKELMRLGKIKDPAQALYMYNAAVNKVIANKKLWETVAQSHGAVLKDKKLVHGVQESASSVQGRHTVTDNLGRELVEKYGWKTPTYAGKPIRGLENHVFEPEIADAVSRMGQMYSSTKSTGDLLRQYDKSLVAVKSVLTKYNPAFHPRTFLGEYILGFLGGMRPATQVDSYKKSVNVWRGHSKEFLGQGASGTGKQADVEAENILRRLQAPAFQRSSSPVVMKFRDKPLNADELRHYYVNSGLKSGFASTDTARGIDATITGGVLRQISDRTQTMTESIEDIGRMAHFIDVIRHSKAKTLQDAIDEAAQVVAKTHLDYTEVTKLERDGMSRVIPFYKWLRLSTPLMAETLLTQPGKALAIPKALDMASRMAGYDPNNLSSLPGGPDAAVPDYLLASGARPVGSINGNSQWFDPTSLSPMAGSAELLDEIRNNPAGALVNTINPMLSLPFKLGFDTQSKGSAPSDDYTKFAASQTPQTNFGRKLLTSEDPSVSTGEKVSKFLLNPGLVSNTPRTIEGAAFQEKKRAEEHRKNVKRKLGILEPRA